MTSERDLSIFKLRKEEVEESLKKLKKHNQELQSDILFKEHLVCKNEIQIMIQRVALRFIDDSIKGLQVNTLKEPVG